MSAAYTLVDLSDLDNEVRQKIVNDANAGGGEYGIRVVEEVINGGARAPIYGYYKDTPEAKLWEKAKGDLGLSAKDVDDGEVLPQQPEFLDPRREAFIREQAAATANTLADRIRAGDDAAVEAITHATAGGGDTGVDNTHTGNIVDTTLQADPEEQEVVGAAGTSATAEAESNDTEERTRSTRRTPSNKAPR